MLHLKDRIPLVDFVMNNTYLSPDWSNVFKFSGICDLAPGVKALVITFHFSHI